MFKGSVVSYPDRGPFGNPRYRGNTTGHLVRDFLETFHPNKTDLFCDPAEGGGTSRDVARAMGIRYKGFDLHSGFDILKDDLGQALGERAKTIFFHPPYAGMIRYSGNVWGHQSHPADLSRCSSVEEFIGKLQLAIMNIFDALPHRGRYGVLLGNWRKNGEYHALPALILDLCPGRLREEIIKVQHNCSSDRKTYKKSFVPIRHETLLVFQKDRMVAAPDYAIFTSRKLAAKHAATWKNLVRRVLAKKGEPMSLTDIYAALETAARERNNKHWREKVRQVLRDHRLFRRVDRGVYTLAA